MDDIPETILELDQPKEGEYEYETLFGSSDSQEWNVFYPRYIQNQWAKARTRMACSRYGMAHAVNAQNKAVQGKDGMRFYEIPGEGVWETYLKINPQAEKEGATLQSVLEQFKEIGYITGYSRLSTIADMKASLDNTRPILTGSKQANWNTVRDNHQYTLWTGSAHIFCIIGYNNSSWIAVNSYWKNNWIFYISFELTDSLFSRYSISDSRDEEIFNAQ